MLNHTPPLSLFVFGLFIMGDDLFCLLWWLAQLHPLLPLPGFVPPGTPQRVTGEETVEMGLLLWCVFNTVVFLKMPQYVGGQCDFESMNGL